MRATSREIDETGNAAWWDYESVALPLSYPGVGKSPYHRPLRSTPPARPGIAVILPAALVVYAALALGVARWWISGLAAPAIGLLLWRLHPRARFAAYIFFSVVALRGLATRRWGALAFALAAVALMQTPSARRAWPRLRRGRTRGDGFC